MDLADVERLLYAEAATYRADAPDEQAFIASVLAELGIEETAPPVPGDADAQEPR